MFKQIIQIQQSHLFRSFCGQVSLTKMSCKSEKKNFMLKSLKFQCYESEDGNITNLVVSVVGEMTFMEIDERIHSIIGDVTLPGARIFNWTAKTLRHKGPLGE